MAKKDGLNGWLQRVRKTGEFSDVVVRVNGEEFHLHMLPLQNASAYFRNLPSTSNGTGTQAHEPKLVTIPDLPGNQTMNHSILSFDPVSVEIAPFHRIDHGRKKLRPKFQSAGQFVHLNVTFLAL